MGCILSLCCDGGLKEKKELECKVQALIKELEAANEKKDKLQGYLNSISKDIRVYMKENERLADINIKYQQVLTYGSEQTACIIMSSALHLKYMDDAVEKKYIKDILRASYDIANH